MTPIEHYWPAEVLIEAFPERFRSLAAKKAAEGEPVKAAVPGAYTAETLEGGCQVYRLVPKLLEGRRP